VRPSVLTGEFESGKSAISALAMGFSQKIRLGRLTAIGIERESSSIYGPNYGPNNGLSLF